MTWLPPDLDKQLEKMQRDWDERARENARYYVSTGKTGLDRRRILPLRRADRRRGNPHRHDQHLPGQGSQADARARNRLRRRPHHARAVRIVRRSARAWTSAARWSPRRTAALADRPNAHRLPEQRQGSVGHRRPRVRFRLLDHRLPAHPQPRSHRELRARSAPPAASRRAVQIPGAGRRHSRPPPDDTWLGVPFSDEAAVAMAERCGFEPRYRHGAGGQYFWLWYFKR